MFEIATQAGLDKASTIQYIVSGIQDESCNKMILYGATTIHELKKKFTLYEAMKEEIQKKPKTPRVHNSKDAVERPHEASTGTGVLRYRCLAWYYVIYLSHNDAVSDATSIVVALSFVLHRYGPGN
ncbi:hypothetical protein M0804_013326 [Polistes exclamans]|nr:hypothetical protein M0804_013326 [Polistes exclamans]